MYAVSTSTAVSQVPSSSSVLATGRGATLTGLKKFSRWLYRPVVVTEGRSSAVQEHRDSLADTVVEAVGWCAGRHEEQPADRASSRHSNSN